MTGAKLGACTFFPPFNPPTIPSALLLGSVSYAAFEGSVWEEREVSLVEI